MAHAEGGPGGRRRAFTPRRRATRRTPTPRRHRAGSRRHRATGELSLPGWRRGAQSLLGVAGRTRFRDIFDRIKVFARAAHFPAIAPLRVLGSVRATDGAGAPWRGTWQPSPGACSSVARPNSITLPPPMKERRLRLRRIAPGADAPALSVVVSDARPEPREELGPVRNAFGMKMSAVTSKDDVPAWVTSALVAEFQAVGLRVAQPPPEQRHPSGSPSSRSRCGRSSATPTSPTAPR